MLNEIKSNYLINLPHHKIIINKREKTENRREKIHTFENDILNHVNSQQIQKYFDAYTQKHKKYTFTKHRTQ